jgi:mRNA-degrading endonuclease RelE of RelBE toxin-antitoxin system
MDCPKGINASCKKCKGRYVESIVYKRVLKWSYKIVFTIDADLIEVYVVDILHSKQQNKDFE